MPVKLVAQCLAVSKHSVLSAVVTTMIITVFSSVPSSANGADASIHAPRWGQWIGGGNNLSLRSHPQVWMCGGRMEDIPCSRVGHIYRKYVPYKVPAGVSLARVSWRLPERREGGWLSRAEASQTPGQVISRCEDVPPPLSGWNPNVKELAKALPTHLLAL